MNTIYEDIIHIKTNSIHKKGTILFIHGFSSSNMIHYNFYKNFDINCGYDYIAFNLPGHQFKNNSKKFKDYDLKKYINYVHKFIIENQLDNIILIGHSMGGGICLFLTKLLKTKIKKIILVSSINISIFKSKIGLTFLNYVNFNNSKGIKKIETIIKDNINYELEEKDKIINEYINYEINRFLDNKAKYLYLGSQLIDPHLYSKIDKILKNLKIPTLFLIGKYDKVIPYIHTIKYLRQIKNPHIIIKTIDNASHICFVDNFEDYNYYLWWFINL